MTRVEVALRRLRNEHLLGPPLAKPEDVVQWLAAVQAQDYLGAKWAIAQRTRRCADADVEAAFQAGKILRTHIMRPTWHFVVPADIRWMQALTAPRVRALNAPFERKMDFTEATFARSHAIIAKALQGGGHQTREELGRILAQAGIPAVGLRLAYLMMRAELDAVICSGPRRGKQFTYALLDERAPAARSLPRQEAMGRLAERYFASHGPALVHDFAWWSGLKVSDAKEAVAMLEPGLGHDMLDGKTYWFVASQKTPPRPRAPLVHLLPNYDEALISYADYSIAVDPSAVTTIHQRETVLANHLIAINGRVVGGWRRTLAKDLVRIELKLLRRLNKAEAAALRKAAADYGRFLGLPVTQQVAFA